MGVYYPVFYQRGNDCVPEVVVARGPREEGVTAQGEYNELFGYAWMLMLDSDGPRLRMLQAVSGSEPWRVSTTGDPSWADRTPPEIPHSTSEIRHIALAFDQSARPVIAYEENNQIWVRQYDPLAQQYVMRGPFPGHDPVLIMDATVAFYIPDSDVLLFHLNGDRTQLSMRAQRDQYAVEHVVMSGTEQMFIDQAIPLPYQIEVLGSLSGTPNGDGVIIRSEMYPVRNSDTFGTAGLSGPEGGIYWPTVIVRDGGTHSVGDAQLTAPAGGIYLPLVEEVDLGTDAISATISAPQSGAYRLVVVVVDIGNDSIGNATLAPPAGGTYALVVVVVDLTQQPYGVDSMGSANLAAPSGGSYVEA